MKKIQISDHFTASRILLFSLPAIGMQLVDNFYQIADGYFISNYIGASEFAAENLIFPPLTIVAAIGLMFGSGSAALISYERGKGNEEEANRLMSMLMGVLLAAGIVISALLYVLMPLLSGWVGASEEMLPHCVTYGRILLGFMPFMMMNMAFHPLLVAADRSALGFAVSVTNAIVNIALDALFIADFRWGLKGAAIATGISWVISSLIPAVVFFRSRSGLRFVRPAKNRKALGKALYNGASEMLDAIAYAVVALVFNLQLMNLAGEAGIDAYAVTEYVSGIFSAVFFGIAMSITSVVGYHLGEDDRAGLRSVWKNGISLMIGLGLINGLICFGLASPIVGIFVGYDEELLRLAAQALRFSALAAVFGGITAFGSSFYTGLNDGTSSLILATIKSFALPLLFVFVLPDLIGIRGIWLANPAAELITAVVLFVMTLRMKDRSYFHNGGKQ